MAVPLIRAGGVRRLCGEALREFAAAIDKAGCAVAGNYAYKEQLSQHRRVMPLNGVAPAIGVGTFVAPSAAVIGDVRVGEKSAVGFGSVLRGDVQPIDVGEQSVVGDRVLVHGSRFAPGGRAPQPTRIGANVSIGNGAIVHAATLADGCVVEAGAVVMDGAVVESGAVVAAGAVVTQGKTVKSGQLWSGSPARYERDLTDDERSSLSAHVQRELETYGAYRRELALSEYERTLESANGQRMLHKDDVTQF